MVFRLFFWSLGFALAVAGGINIIAFLNILTAGYTFTDYLRLITDKPSLYFFLIGVTVLSVSILYPEKNNEDR